MNIVHVEYGETRTQGYNARRLTLRAELAEGDDPDDVKEQLKALVRLELYPEISERVQELERERQRLETEIGRHRQFQIGR